MSLLNRPKAVVMEQQCRKNIASIKQKSDEMRAQFRPHFKTHQSIEIGRWFRDEGISGITVSTPQMAEYFIEDGWDDITIGFPFYSGQIDDLKRLSADVRFRLFVHSAEDVSLIAREIRNPVSILIEVDAGYGRSGIPEKNTGRIQSVIDEIRKSDHVTFHGFYVHDGDTYNVQGKDNVAGVIHRNLQALKRLKSMYPKASICLGDTPSCSLLTDFSGVDELSPGNLIFYDLMQITIGSCDYSDIGLLIQAPVAQQKPGADQCIIHGGAVHFSKDRLSIDGNVTYGQPVTVSKKGSIQKIEGTSLVALSQEHGTISGLSALQKASDSETLQSVWICPVHSCLTANLFSEYQCFSGNKIEKRILS